MNDIGILTKTITTLILNPQGLNKHQLSKIVGVSASELNSFLYNHPDSFEHDNSTPPIWRMKARKSVAKNSFFEEKFENTENAKVFSQRQFDSLADWSIGAIDDYKFQYTTKSKNVICCQSKSEVNMLKYLEDNDLVLDMGGQVLEIKYDSPFRIQMTYYPDIVALTKNGKIAIIEVKPTTAMSYHKNLEKYEALSKYCKANGFIYTMIDPDDNFTTIEELKSEESCDCIEYMFYLFREDVKKDKNKLFMIDDATIDDWYEISGEDCTKTAFRRQVHSMIINENWYNFYKNGFKAYNRPVKLNNSHEIIDYI